MKTYIIFNSRFVCFLNMATELGALGSERKGGTTDTYVTCIFCLLLFWF